MIRAIVFDAYGTLFDVGSVADAVEAAFPGKGEFITGIWRQKQLEYSWLRSLMGRYADFWTVTRDSLAFTLRTLDLPVEPAMLDRLAGAYNRLTVDPDAASLLRGLSGRYRLAILSNGTPAMLTELIGRSGLSGLLDAVLSVDETGAYKPARAAYAGVERRLGVRPAETLFVTANGFDAAGARSFGFHVARIERTSSVQLAGELLGGAIGPELVIKALRSQEECLGFGPDATVASLLEIRGALEELQRDLD